LVTERFVLWTALLFVRSAVRLVYAEVPEPVQLLGDYTTGLTIQFG
jgi:hypothetical protein